MLMLTLRQSHPGTFDERWQGMMRQCVAVLPWRNQYEPSGGAPFRHTALSAVESDLLYEVVDGHTVEKEPRGAYETLLGLFLNTRLDSFARDSNRGWAVSEMLFDLGAGLSQRRPDVAYVSYDRWPRQRRVPRTQAWAAAPGRRRARRAGACTTALTKWKCKPVASCPVRFRSTPSFR
jgi:hypothetical protein